jgi:hypothetical protein
MTAEDLGIPGISGATELARTPATTTYRAVEDASGRSVIVKVLSRDATPEVRARFDYDQARLAELAEHPNVVRVLGHGYTPAGKPWVQTEAVEGGSMADRVGSGLDGPGVLRLGIRVAGALESAHRRDVVHGDLRPDDVRLGAGDDPRVADFGLALVTGHGPDRATDVAGLAHAAPEQLQTHLPTPASDVYALGSVLYALLAGGPAFVRPGDTSVAAVGARILTDAPRDLRADGVPAPVVDAIERALQKNPADRWASAEAFGIALQQAEVTLGLPITPMTVLGPDRVVARPEPQPETAPETAPPPATKPPAKGRTGVLVGAGLAVVAAVVAGFLLLGGDDGDDDDNGGRTPVTRADRADVELAEASDDSGTITVGVIDSWSDVDGRPLSDGAGGQAPDLVAAEDADAFLQVGGFAISGIELTVVEGVDDAAALLDARVSGRGLADECLTDREPGPREVAGFVGLLQRFDGCDGNGLVVFAGIAGGRGLVAEVHLVDEEDEAALDAVLDSVSVAP